MSHDVVLMPNTTQVPNTILDNLGALSDTELRILLVVTRQTLGWSKERDWLSLKQIEQRTGRKHSAISAAIGSLVDRQMLQVFKEDGTELATAGQRQEAGQNHEKFYYALNVEGHIQNLDKAYPESGQGHIQNSDTTKPTHIQNPLLTKDTDTNVSEQAPKLPPTDPTPKASASEEASAPPVFPSAAEMDAAFSADPPAKKTAPKTLSGFKEALRGEPPQDRAGYARACSGLVRRMTGYAYLKDAHQVDLIPLITKAIFKGLNGTGPPTQAQVERLYSSLMMAKDTLTPDKDAADVWPWMTRRVEAIMFSECVSVPPFDFRWTHKAPDGITWREKLCPKII